MKKPVMISHEIRIASNVMDELLEYVDDYEGETPLKLETLIQLIIEAALDDQGFMKTILEDYTD